MHEYYLGSRAADCLCPRLSSKHKVIKQGSLGISSREMVVPDSAASKLKILKERIMEIPQCCFNCIVLRM